MLKMTRQNVEILDGRVIDIITKVMSAGLEPVVIGKNDPIQVYPR